MKRIRRIVRIQCPTCSGLGRVAGTSKKCSECKGKGEVDRVINEIVHDDEEVKTT